MTRKKPTTGTPAPAAKAATRRRTEVQIKVETPRMEDAIARAQQETTWEGACAILYAALETVEEHREMVDAATHYARTQEQWKQAGPILYQVANDLDVLTKEGDKLAHVTTLLQHARRHAQAQRDWDQAALVLYQAARDLTMLTRGTRQAMLQSVSALATATVERAQRVLEWSDAAGTLYAGFDAMQAVLSPN